MIPTPLMRNLEEGTLSDWPMGNLPVNGDGGFGIHTQVWATMPWTFFFAALFDSSKDMLWWWFFYILTNDAPENSLGGAGLKGQHRMFYGRKSAPVSKWSDF